MRKGVLKKILAIAVLAAGIAAVAVKVMKKAGIRESENQDHEEEFKSCEEDSVNRTYVPLSHDTSDKTAKEENTEA